MKRKLKGIISSYKLRKVIHKKGKALRKLCKEYANA